MSHQAANAFILGPLLVATVLFGIWAAIDIYRMSRYSKRVKLYAANYSRAIIAHSIPGNDLANDPDFQWVATVVNDPVPEYRNTWPRRGTL
jgi:hypothetical protein